MTFYKIPAPDLSTITPERKEYLLEKKYKIYFQHELDRYSGEVYLPWEKVKYLQIPEWLQSHEELWFVIRSCRFWRTTPVKNIDGKKFTLERVEFLEELLHNLDLSLGWNFLNIPLSKNEQKIFLQNGIAEEAISSSQLEGALTSSKVAREMIAKNRRPNSRDERMILNNYQAMNFIKDELVKERLSKEKLIELQTILTKDTLENPDEIWRFRRDDDEIVVQDKLTGDVYHIPPQESILQTEIDQFIEYANDNDSSWFTHPFIKAVILHFWIWFLHPFCDGNWRTARAIFYWYLIRKWYWGFNYIPISQVIKNSTKQYMNAYLYSEQDGGDMTYFLVYIASKTNLAFEEFRKYVNRKRDQQHSIATELVHLGINDRQSKLIGYFLEHPKWYTNNSIHKNYYNISINTAKWDLEWLFEKAFLRKEKQWRYVNYFPASNLPELLK